MSESKTIGEIISRMIEQDYFTSVSCESLMDRAISVKQDQPFEYWRIIREIWSIQMPFVMEGQRCPYFFDWFKVFTPIEENVWSELRSVSTAFYPQVPVGNRFIDFGDPIKKIGIECDGASYHDRAKDTERDMELFDLGWTIYHLKGKECQLHPYPDKDEDSFESLVYKWMISTSGGLIKSILAYHYGHDLPGLQKLHVNEALSRHLFIGAFHG